MEYDLLFKDGLVCDGSGTAPRVKDVATRGDTIVAIADKIEDHEDGRVIDAKGKVVAPGFIDVHGHSDYLLLMDPGCDSKITQGITTDVGGNCGLSPGPYSSDGWYVDWWVDNPNNFFAVSRSEGIGILRDHGVDLSWRELGGFFDELERSRPALNYTGLVGHYVLRAAAYGEPGTQPWRQPSRQELDTMKGMLRESMEAGARGLSCAFHHTDPELDVSAQEFHELASVVAEYGGVFAYHLRSYTDLLLTSVREAIELAEKTGVNTTISHLWGDGKEYWGKVRYAMDAIEAARHRGVPIWCDVLLTLPPRNYMSGGIKTLLPDDVFEAGDKRWADYFGDPVRKRKVAERLAQGGENRWYKRRFNPMSYWPLWDEMTRVVESNHAPEYVGKTVHEVGSMIGGSSYEAICELLRINEGSVETSMERTTDADIAEVLSRPVSMIGTDGSPIHPIQSTRTPNPRLYCSFPLLFRKFVRELGVLRVEEAVMKATRTPADFLGISDRGRLEEGAKADIVVFDLQDIEDFQHLTSKPAGPAEYSRGVSEVAVNGHLVLSGSGLTTARPGVVLR